MFELDAESLREMLRYEPETGQFFWRIKPSRSTRIGSLAGRKDRQGRWAINIKYRKYSSSRLAWLYVHGEWPKHQIDHINRNPGDNRICNLRDVTCAENLRNRSSNVSIDGHGRGYSKHKQTGKWQAQVSINGALKYLGLFDREEDARSAARTAKGLM